MTQDMCHIVQRNKMLRRRAAAVMSRRACGWQVAFQGWVALLFSSRRARASASIVHRLTQVQGRAVMSCWLATAALARQRHEHHTHKWSGVRRREVLRQWADRVMLQTQDSKQARAEATRRLAVAKVEYELDLCKEDLANCKTDLEVARRLHLDLTAYRAESPPHMHMAYKEESRARSPLRTPADRQQQVGEEHDQLQHLHQHRPQNLSPLLPIHAPVPALTHGSSKGMAEAKEEAEEQAEEEGEEDAEEDGSRRPVVMSSTPGSTRNVASTPTPTPTNTNTFSKSHHHHQHEHEHEHGAHSVRPSFASSASADSVTSHHQHLHSCAPRADMEGGQGVESGGGGGGGLGSRAIRASGPTPSPDATRPSAAATRPSAAATTRSGALASSDACPASGDACPASSLLPLPPASSPAQPVASSAHASTMLDSRHASAILDSRIVSASTTHAFDPQVEILKRRDKCCSKAVFARDKWCSRQVMP
jgi:hypothetical protein